MDHDFQASSSSGQDALRPEEPLGVIPVEPLPADYEQDLQQIDQLLQAYAARTCVPRDIADLVYDVTLGLVWRREEPIPFPSGGRSIRETAWGRMSMAAAVALAVLVGLIFMQSPEQVTQEPMLASGGVLPASVEWILLETGSEAGDMSYLLDTRDVTVDELTGDLENLISELEL